MLNKKLTELEIKALALKYVNLMPDAAINHELGLGDHEKLIPLHLILISALRKLKAGGLSDFQNILTSSV